MTGKRQPTPRAARAFSVQDIDTFNEAQHRAQRRIRLAIHALEHPGEYLVEDAADALAELLTEAADDLVTADTTVQRAWKGGAAR